MKSTLILFLALVPVTLFGVGQAVTVSQDSAHIGTFNTAGVTSYVIGQPVTFTGGTTYNPLPIQASLTTIALLRSYTITSAIVNGSAIQVTGYYAANDGGGGLYVWNSTSTATDNGGTVIQATGVATGRWLLQYSGLINARWFGAYGDGVHDDTSAIQAAITYAASNSVSLYIPTGTYLTATLHFASTDGLELYGDGVTSTILKNTGSNASVLALTGQLHSLYFHDFGIDGTGGTGDGLDFSGQSGEFLDNSTFSRIKASNCTTDGFNFRTAFSVTLDALQGSSNGRDQIRIWGNPGVSLCNCTWSNTATGHAGLRIFTSATVIACNGDFTSPSAGYWGVFGADGGADSEGQTGYPNITFVGCNVESFTGTGVSFINNPNKTRFINCTFLSAPSSSNCVAVQCKDMFATNPLSFESCNFAAGSGSTWKNSIPVHNNGGTTCYYGFNNYNSLTQTYNDAFSLAYPIPEHIMGLSDSRVSLNGNTGSTVTGEVEFSDLGRFSMGDGSATNDFLAFSLQPSTGSYKAGDVVWKVGSPTISGTQTLMGWKRITTGSSHTTYTDWAPLYGLEYPNKLVGGSGLYLDSNTHVVNISDGTATGSTLLLPVASGNSQVVGGNMNAAVDNRYSYVAFQARTIQFGYVNDALSTYTEYARFQGDGKLNLDTYADGSLSIVAGVVTSSSDERLKNIKGVYSRGLSDILKLHPVSYTWKPESGIVSDTVYSGFTAQDVQRAIPEAVTKPDARGYLGVQDRPITAALVNAVKELAARPGSAEIRFFEAIALIALVLSIRANLKQRKP